MGKAYADTYGEKQQDVPANSVNENSIESKGTEKEKEEDDEHDDEDGSDGESTTKSKDNGPQPQSKSEADSTPDALQSKDRFDALVRDRDSLRAEVTDMRKSLEEIQSKHRADMEALQQNVDDAESKKGEAETQFQKLLERVNIIKSQLGERLKEDAVCWKNVPILSPVTRLILGFLLCCV